ncbi:unnamed protein product, partial [Rotaria sp. Silwood1]
MGKFRIARLCVGS